MAIKPDRFSLLAGGDMAAQNFKEEDWGDGDTKLAQNWHKISKRGLPFIDVIAYFNVVFQNCL